MKGEYLPGLTLLLDLCLAAGVSLVSVMQGSPLKRICPPPEVKPLKCGNSKPSHGERESALKEALAYDPPRSLSAVASMIGVDRKKLRQQFPELSALVVKSFREFTLSQTAESHKQRMKLGESVIAELVAKGVPLTRRNFEIAAGKRIWPKDILRWQNNQRIRLFMEILQGKKFSSNPPS